MSRQVVTMGRTAPNEWIKAPWEKGGHSCRKCGTLLSFEDMLGQNRPGAFIPKGYVCPNCKNRFPSTIREGPANSRMNWKSIA